MRWREVQARTAPARMARIAVLTPADRLRDTLARLPERQPSSTTTARWVRDTEPMIVASSKGRSVRRSITSASIPPEATCPPDMCGIVAALLRICALPPDDAVSGLGFCERLQAQTEEVDAIIRDIRDTVLVQRPAGDGTG